jgi:hypothetical protein
VIGLYVLRHQNINQIVDSNTMKPILLFCEKSSSEHHIDFQLMKIVKVFQVLLGTYVTY